MRTKGTGQGRKVPDDCGRGGRPDGGWVAQSEFSERSAYRYTALDSIYAHPGLRRRGIGKRLLEDLVTRAKGQGFHSIVTVIGAEQASSLRLHQCMGFKFGQWIDVDHLQRML